MSGPIVVVGAGGFGRETIDVIRAINEAAPQPLWDLLGVVDDAPSTVNEQRLERLGVALLGGIAALDTLGPEVNVAIGVGSPPARQAIAGKLASRQLTVPSLVHPTAVIGSEFCNAEGSVVCAGVSVGTNVRVGRHVHLNPHSVIGHDAVLEDFVSVNPNATISGECTIGTGTLVGAASVVLQGIRVGEGSIVGAAACVINDTDSEVTLVGVPASALTKVVR